MNLLMLAYLQGGGTNAFEEGEGAKLLFQEDVRLADGSVVRVSYYRQDPGYFLCKVELVEAKAFDDSFVWAYSRVIFDDKEEDYLLTPFGTLQPLDGAPEGWRTFDPEDGTSLGIIVLNTWIDISMPLQLRSFESYYEENEAMNPGELPDVTKWLEKMKKKYPLE